MKLIQKIKEEGISLKHTHILMVILTLIILCVLVFETFRSFAIYNNMSGATDDYIALERDAETLMSASDFLTDEVQLFTITQIAEHMYDYFDESNNVRRRDNAVINMSENPGEADAFEYLKSAMDVSNELMKTEIYAMRLICDAAGYTDMPREVAETQLSPEDFALTGFDKIQLAQNLVHNKAYYEKKTEIRDNIKQCINKLTTDTQKIESDSMFNLQRSLMTARILLILQSIMAIFVLSLNSHLGIRPIINGIDKIKQNLKIPVAGSYEFRYLAKTYNHMYDIFYQNIERLNHDISHDTLTGLCNRKAYDVLIKGIDLKSTAVVFIDIDNFKEINDTYGHDAGDKILKKIASILPQIFRRNDYICRIGGDEFVVFMLHIGKGTRSLIESKIDLINKELSDTTDGLPLTSVSAGAAFGKNERNTQEFIKHADQALYNSKKRGRSRCSFYEN